MMEKENTFIGKDDLIHCSVCKEPKQAWLPENDLLGVRLRYRQCACERDANAIEKAEQEEKERRVQIAKNRQNCFDEATMKNKTFANTEEMTPAICNLICCMRVQFQLLYYGKHQMILFPFLLFCKYQKCP